MNAHVIRSGSSIGVLSANVLKGDADGEVIAVFRQSFYARFRAGIVCIGSADIGNGPLNLLCADSEGVDWRNFVSLGAAVRCSDRCLRSNNISIPLSRATKWVPPTAPPYRNDTVARGILAVADLLPASLPDGGLARMLCRHSSSVSAVERRAFLAIDRLLSWRKSDSTDGDLAEAVALLLGLGPGLTPSGDDFLAGALNMLRLAGEHNRVRQLSREIKAQALHLTNEISIAHLAAAGEGMLSADLHDALNAVVAGDIQTFARSLRVFSRRVHHSPWDALVGAVTIGRILSVEAGATCQRKLG